MTTPTDLELAYAHLAGKKATYDALWDYYDGDHPLVYNASRLQEIFTGIDANFSENWAAVAVDTILDRIAIERFQLGNDDRTSDMLADLWQGLGLDLAAYDAHRCALVTGEAFIVCGQADDGQPEAYYNDSRMVHMFYEPARPSVPRMAAKWWEEGYDRDKITYLTLYYADHFEYYVVPKSQSDISNAKAFVPAETPEAPNEWGRLPVFHVRREQRAIVSELSNIVPVQAQLNKTLSDMMIAAEFGAFKQRYIISQASPGQFRNAPNEIWDVPAGDGEGQPTTVGEFAATDLGNYLNAIERSANVVATLAGIPKTLLFEQGNVPSGASLRALEAPLVKKANRYAGRWEPVWRDVLRWLLLAGGLGEVDAADIDVIWAEAATTQPETDATTVKTLVEAGVPLRTALRRQGWSDAELDQLAKDEADEQAATANLAAAYMAQAETNMNQQAAEGAPGEDVADAA
jgi:hypothetical protein